jgi:protein-tyrosine-phosphatase
MQICFVCTGNIIRSPWRNLFKHLAGQAGCKYQVARRDGCGMSEPPDDRPSPVAARPGGLSRHAGQFQRRDFDRFDLILAMDGKNREIWLPWRALRRPARSPAREFDRRVG